MRIVCVTGMHRSGTSLVSRVLNILGVDLGPDSQLMEPKPDNPSGFWENTDISGFNDDLLAVLGGSWLEPPVLVDGWEEDSKLDEMRDRAALVLDAAFAGDDPPAVAGWKDPRTSLLVPFWRTLAPIDGTVLVIRHPWDVAASLANRDGLDAETSAHLWLRYTVAAWRADPARLVLRYEDFFEDATGAVERLTAHLGLPAPDAAQRDAIETFVDPGLRHYSEEPSGAGPAMELAVLMFELLHEGRNREVQTLADTLHAGWVAEFRAAELDRLGESLAIERDVATAHNEELITERDEALEARDGIEAELTRARDDALAERDKVETELTKARDDALAERDKVETELSTAVEEALTERDKVETEYAKARDDALAERDKVETELSTAVEEALTERDKVETELTKARDDALAERDKVETELSTAVEEALTERDKVETELTKARDDALAERDKVETELSTAVEEALTERDKVETEYARARDDALAERDKVETELTKARDDALAERDKVETELSKAVEEALAERDKVETELTKAVEEALAERDRVASELSAERDRLLEERDATQQQLEEERAVAVGQIEALSEHRDQLIGERAAALQHRDELQAERDEARTQANHFEERAAHFEERTVIQSDMLSRTEAETARVRHLWEDAEERVVALQQRNDGLETIIQRWRVDRLERIRRRLGFK